MTGRFPISGWIRRRRALRRRFNPYIVGTVERILRVSRLRPFTIQKLCCNAVNRMHDDGRTTVRVADVGAEG